VFVTSETEEGLERGKQYNGQIKNNPALAVYDLFLGDEIHVKVASEPSDIIWENRQFTANKIFFRKLVVFIVIVALLAGSAFFIFYCQTTALKYKNKYPVVDCDALIKDDYGDWETSKDRLLRDAKREYTQNVEYELRGKAFNYFGQM